MIAKSNKTIFPFLILVFFTFCIADVVFGSEPVLFFSDMTDGPTSGWEGSNTKGAAVTIWGLNFGTSRGSSYVTCAEVNLTNDSDYAEWGATTNPTTARGLQRITFWLNSSMAPGSTTISVTTSDGRSDTIPFHCRALGENHIYFLSRSGSDSNNGLYASSDGGSDGPWFSASKVRDLREGDIAYFRAGTWNEIDDWDAVIDFWALKHGNGRANKTISISSHPGEVAQIGDNSTKYAIQHHGTSTPDTLSYWTFSKFVLRGSSGVTKWGLRSPGSSDHIRFIGNDTSTTYGGASAMCFSGGGGGQTYFYFYGNYCHDAGVDTRGQTAPRKAYPLYFKGYGWHNHIYIGWNEFAYNEWGRGMQLYGHQSGDWMDNVYIHDNYIHHNGMTGAILGGGDGGDYTFVRTLYFYNNIIAENGHRGYPGIKIHGGTTPGEGYYYIYNNTFYHNVAGEIHIMDQPVELMNIKNNIIWASDEYYIGTGTDACGGTKNCYYGATDIPKWDAGSISQDPKFVSADSLNFHLHSDSPAIDAGVNVGIPRDFDGNPRPIGSGYDIGAYEYSGNPGDIDPPEPPGGVKIVQ